MTKEISSPYLNKLKTGLLLCILFATNTACAIELDSNDTYALDCNNIAKQVKFIRPEAKEFDGYFDLWVGHYHIKIPPNYIRIDLNVNGELTVEYPNKASLSLNTTFLRKREKYQIYENIDVTQFPKIAYLKTNCDKWPVSEAEKKLWKLGLSRKKYIFEYPEDTIVTKSGRLTYYLANYSKTRRVATASIVDEKYDYTYLKMDSHNIAHEDFKKIVLNVKLWE